MIEIIWFFLDLLITVINDITTQKKVDVKDKKEKGFLKKSNDNKIFTVTQSQNYINKKVRNSSNVMRYKFTN